MQRKSLLLGVVFLFFLTACSITVPRLATETAIGPSIGVSTSTCFFGFFCQNADISIKNAAANGKIVKVSTVDIETKTNILGIITQYTTIVTGYKKDQLTEDTQKPEPAIENNKQSQVLDTPLVENDKKTNESKELGQETIVTHSEPTKKISAAERIKIAEEQIKLAEEKQSKTPNSSPKIEKNPTKIETIKNENLNIEDNLLSSLPQIKIKGSSLSDLSRKLKSTSELMMNKGDLYPTDVVFDSKRNTFVCNFIRRKSSFIKLGLYYGPKNTGCESCDNVIIRNPGSEIIYDEIVGNLIIQVIAIKVN